MPKVMIVRVEGHYDNYDDYVSRLVENLSDWEEVTDEELKYLKDNKYILSNDLDCEIAILTIEDVKDVRVKITGIIKKIKEREEKLQKEREEKLQKRKEAAEQKQIAKIEKDRAALAKLIEQNPDLVKEVMKNV